MHKNVIQPLLARNSDIDCDNNVYITATEKAVPLMQRTGIDASNMVPHFY
jgi:hypothetical protein